MKRVFIIFFILFFSFLSISESNNNISYIDIEKVLSSSKPGVSLIDQLQEINNINNEKFNKKEELLKIKETKLISQKNVISDDVFK